MKKEYLVAAILAAVVVTNVSAQQAKDDPWTNNCNAQTGVCDNNGSPSPLSSLINADWKKIGHVVVSAAKYIAVGETYTPVAQTQNGDTTYVCRDSKGNSNYLQIAVPNSVTGIYSCHDATTMNLTGIPQ